MKARLADFESEEELVKFAEASTENLMLTLTWCGAMESGWDASEGEFTFRATPLMLKVGPSGLMPLLLDAWKEERGS